MRLFKQREATPKADEANPVLNALKAAVSSLQLLDQLVKGEGAGDPYLIDAKAFQTQVVANLQKHLKAHGVDWEEKPE